jgi:hypothetical protein
MPVLFSNFSSSGADELLVAAAVDDSCRPRPPGDVVALVAARRDRSRWPDPAAGVASRRRTGVTGAPGDDRT